MLLRIKNQKIISQLEFWVEEMVDNKRTLKLHHRMLHSQHKNGTPIENLIPKRFPKCIHNQHPRERWGSLGLRSSRCVPHLHVQMSNTNVNSWVFVDVRAQRALWSECWCWCWCGDVARLVLMLLQRASELERECENESDWESMYLCSLKVILCKTTTTYIPRSTNTLTIVAPIKHHSPRAGARVCAHFVHFITGGESIPRDTCT